MRKYFYTSILLVTIIVLGLFSGAYATTQDNSGKTIYVAKNGTDLNDGLTPTTPKRNIESALNAADNGDTIHVATGVYSTHLIISKNITLIGDNQENTIIDGNQAGNCIKITPETNVSITGFTLKNGKQLYNGDNGAGIQNKGIATLINSTITDNNADYGGGIYNYGIMIISNVTIKNNKANSFGGGIRNNGGMAVKHCNITGNTAGYGG